MSAEPWPPCAAWGVNPDPHAVRPGDDRFDGGRILHAVPGVGVGKYLAGPRQIAPHEPDQRVRLERERAQPGGQAQPAIQAPGRMIETFELDGAPQSSATDPRNGGSLPRPPSRGGRPRSGPELVADAVAKPVSVWLPAGAHAQAVVLAGVDASAGVSSQGDPRPVLLRITGPAWTAAQDGTAMQVDVDGCTVTGAAHGDLSSEKVYVRLRTMTCAVPEPGTGERPGAVVETDVAGFVAGSGKTGVRGPVVSREGALVEKVFLAGMVSGIGQGRRPGVPAAGGRDRHRRRRGQHVLERHRARRPRRRGVERRPEGRRLHDPPRRAVPAGGPAPGRDEGDAGVPRRRPH